MTSQPVSASDRAARYRLLLEKVPCNLCGADDYRVIYPPRYEDAQPDEFTETYRSSSEQLLLDQLVQCRRCGLQYLNPRPRSELVLEGYSSGADETFVSQQEARMRTFARSLRIIEALAPARGRILDIGTAGAAFLGAAKQRGWDPIGCEPSRWLADWGSKRYGVPVFAGTVFEMGLEPASMDVVTLWDVLEHTPDPKAVLLECQRILKRDGLLVVNIPDSASLVARLMGRKWVFLASVHLYYFTAATARRMLAESGLETIVCRRHWQILELGYILTKVGLYLPGIGRTLLGLARALRIADWQVPYWMGQSMIVARKKT